MAPRQNSGAASPTWMTVPWPTTSTGDGGWSPGVAPPAQAVSARVAARTTDTRMALRGFMRPSIANATFHVPPNVWGTSSVGISSIEDCHPVVRGASGERPRVEASLIDRGLDAVGDIVDLLEVEGRAFTRDRESAGGAVVRVQEPPGNTGAEEEVLPAWHRNMGISNGSSGESPALSPPSSPASRERRRVWAHSAR